MLYTGSGETGHWRSVSNIDGEFIVYDDERAPYMCEYSELCRKGTDFIFIRKSFHEEVENLPWSPPLNSNPEQGEENLGGKGQNCKTLKISVLKTKSKTIIDNSPAKVPRLKKVFYLAITSYARKKVVSRAKKLLTGMWERVTWTREKK